MSFPVSPSDGQRYQSPNGTVYQYSASRDAWEVVMLDSQAVNLWSNRNVIINGDMEIAQRGTTFNQEAGFGGVQYSIDRFYTAWNAFAGRTITITQDTDVPTSSFKHSMKILATSTTALGASDHCMPAQPIEGYNIARIYGQEFTFSFWVKATKTGNMDIYFQSPGVVFFAHRFIINTANVWEKKTVTTTHPGVSGWNQNNLVGMYVVFAISAGSNISYVTYDQWGNTGIPPAGRTDFLSTSGDAVWITGVQLEPGNQATNYEFIDYGRQLLQCMRYYYDTNGQAPPYVGRVNATTAADFAIVHPVQMRERPTLIVSNLSSFTVSYGASSMAPTALTIIYSSYGSKKGAMLRADITGATVGDAAYLIGVEASETKLSFNAELGVV